MNLIEQFGFGMEVFMLLSISILLSICFLQSGVDKIIDRSGNEVWLKEHFSNSAFKGWVSALITIITFLELLTAICFVIGIGMCVMYQSIFLIQCGLLLSSITLLCLFLGQRVAKDYEGAYVLVVYFILTMFGCYVSIL